MGHAPDRMAHRWRPLKDLQIIFGRQISPPEASKRMPGSVAFMLFKPTMIQTQATVQAGTPMTVTEDGSPALLPVPEGFCDG